MNESNEKTARREGTPTDGKEKGKDLSAKKTNTGVRKSQGAVSSMLSENNLYRKAVHIAAVVMVAAGLCRYESVDKCRKVWPPEESSCVLCVENWLIMRARKEMRHG